MNTRACTVIVFVSSKNQWLALELHHFVIPLISRHYRKQNDIEY